MKDKKVIRKHQKLFIMHPEAGKELRSEKIIVKLNKNMGRQDMMQVMVFLLV